MTVVDLKKLSMMVPNKCFGGRPPGNAITID